MYEYAGTTKENKSRVFANSVARKNKSNVKQAFGFIDNRPEAVAQRKLQEVVNNNPRLVQFRTFQEKAIQCKMESDASKLTWTSSAAPTLNGFTLNPEPQVTLANETATSKPDLIPDMLDPEITTTIQDPSVSRAQRLTKMHMIRGRFDGPGDPSNLRLGTAMSNNISGDSHYYKVEKPIGEYLKMGSPGDRAFYYSVDVGDKSVPSYLTARLPGKSAKTVSFVNSWCPSTFDCNATFFKKLSDGTWEQSSQQETVRLDVGA